MHREALAGSRVEEANLVGNILANRVSNQGFASLDIPDDERVIVLTSERGKVLLVEAEIQRLDQHLVQLKPVNDLKGIEVPNDDISLETHMSLLA